MALRGIIAAVSPEGVIGLNNRIPWHHPGDLKRFKEVTRGSTVIMGRRTFESMGSRPLPDRRNLVITRRPIEGVECFDSIEAALATCQDQTVWFLGGRGIYAEAMQHADLIDLTYVPDRIDDPAAVKFPPIDESVWEPGPRIPHEYNGRLERQVFRRRRSDPDAT